MNGKIICALALVAILVIIDPAAACKVCGTGQPCTCTNALTGSYHSRSWDDNGRSPVHLTVPVIGPSLGLGLGGWGGLGGGCYRGGYGRYGGHYGGYGDDCDGYRGYNCRCRRNRWFYDDY